MSQTYYLVIDGAKYEVDLPRLTGFQLRALTAVPAGCQLIMEGSGNAQDAVINDDDEVELTLGPVVLYVRPPTSFGGAG